MAAATYIMLHGTYVPVVMMSYVATTRLNVKHAHAYNHRYYITKYSIYDITAVLSCG